MWMFRLRIKVTAVRNVEFDNVLEEKVCAVWTTYRLYLLVTCNTWIVRRIAYKCL
jgi:hypothetical protein